MLKEIMHNQEFYRLDPSDRILSLSGIPLEFLSKPSTTLDKLSFQSMAYVVDSTRTISIIPSDQITFLNGLRMSIRSIGDSRLYVVGSHPSEEPSFSLLTLLAREYCRERIIQGQTPTFAWIDMGSPPWGLLRGEIHSPEFAVISGISQQSDNQRLERTKDFLNFLAKKSTTVFLLLHTLNALEFSMLRLNLRPKAVVQLGRTVHRTVV